MSYDADGNYIDDSADTSSDWTQSDWDNFYNQYGDVGGGYDPATSPTEQDVKDAIESGSSSNPVLKTFFDTLGTGAVNFLKKNLIIIN
jgi:hypothetical protein